MFDFNNSNSKKREQKLKRFKTFFELFEHVFALRAFEQNKKFNSLDFFILYNDFFGHFFFPFLKCLFSNQELESTSLSSFEKIFILRDQKSFFNQEIVDYFFDKEIYDQLFFIWRVSTRDSIMQDYFESGEELLPLLQNDNLLLINEITRQKDFVLFWIFEIKEIRKQNYDFFTTTQTKIPKLLENYNQTLLFLAEVFFFRKILIQQFFQLRGFRFCTFGFLQLILLLDCEIFFLVDSLVKFKSDLKKIIQERYE